jgi:cell division protein FtsA
MADIKEFFVAIDLGSSKVTAIAGRKQPDGAIEVLAFTQEPSQSFIRKGRISNIDKMTQCAKNIKETLETQLKKRISKAYVGIGGMGMHTVTNTIQRSFSEKHIISQDIMEALRVENLQKSTPERHILGTVPQEYKVGTQFTNEPVGMLADTLEAHYLNIVANSSMAEQIRNCFRAAGIEVVEMPITALCLSDVMLTEPEKRSGCVFVDMGAETTSVAIFKSNILRHLAIIPLGGANITRDLTSLQIEEDEAETLKLKWGAAITNGSDNNPPIVTSDGREFPYTDFAGLIEARVEEIVLNIEHQVKFTNYEKNQLVAGIIITGGASMLKNMENVVSNLVGLSKLRVVKNTRFSIRGPKNLNVDPVREGDYAAVLALIEKADQNCYGGELSDEAPVLFTEETEATATATTTTDIFGEPIGGTQPAAETNVAPVTEPVEEEPVEVEEEEVLEEDPDEEPEEKGPNPITNGFKKTWNWLCNIVNDDRD